MKKILKHLWIAIGTISLIIGVIGLLLPVIPTTPFILLSAFCYARGSKRLHNWLTSNRFFGFYIKNYEEGKGIPFKIKVYAISLLWLSTFFTLMLFLNNFYMKVSFIILVILLTIYIISIKPKTKI
jgi:uncharacterized membrane protein YbaN (DUF454 family)